MLFLQASKLGLGKNKSIISYYSTHQVVQFCHFPLVVTFIAQASANTGMCCLALFPGSPPRVHMYCMTFDPHKELRGEAGEFYHVSDIKGREDCI